MSAPQIKHFTSAKNKPLTFEIDDETFRRRVVTVEAADSVAALNGTLGKAATDYTSAELMDMVKPFIDPDDWDRFDAYVRKWVEPPTFYELVKWITGAVTEEIGVDPTQPASLPQPSASTGEPSPDGVSATALPIP